MNKRTKITIAAVLAVLILLLLWYICPRRLDTVIGLEGKSVTSIAVTGMFLEDSWDASGVYWPVRRTFTIKHDDADSEAILELLRSSRYSRSLRSLLSPDSVSLGGEDGVIAVSMVLDGKESVRISIGSLVSFSLPGDDGFTVARSNDSLFALLEEYIRANGVEE